MWPFMKTYFLLIVAASIFAGFFVDAVAEPPPRVDSKPVDSQAVDSPAQQRIREALEGTVRAETGDGVLDDILGIIQKQGSILDGSVLDPELDESSADTLGHLASKKAYAAEQLLRASRLLEDVGPADQQQSDLVNRMRAQAAELLTE